MEGQKMDFLNKGIKGICLCVFLFYMATAQLILAADENYGRNLAMELRNSVVRIESPENGFGWVVGERGSDLYIVTGNHVVSPNDEYELYKTVTIRFHHAPKAVVAKPIKLDDRSVKLDIGVLRAPKPEGFIWRKDTMATAREHKAGMKVWYIGKAGEWKIPHEPGIIDNEDVSAGKDIYLNMPVLGGSSGAPLISDYGLLGMLQTDNTHRTVSQGIAIDAIMTACKHNRISWTIEPAPFSNRSMFLAKQNYDLGFYNEALWRFEQEANKGNLTAMVWAARIYLEEEKNNCDKAISWVKQAANSDDEGGMFLLGFMHHLGYCNLAKDNATVLYWFRKSANHNYPEALLHLGLAYHRGIWGQQIDKGKAIMYYRKLCQLGYRSASRYLEQLGQAPCD
jgi:hypothetical protein